eukprot:5955242-Prymnesium_polylepis.1
MAHPRPARRPDQVGGAASRSHPDPPPLGTLAHCGAGAEDIKKHKWFRGLNWAALYNKQMEAGSVNAFVPTDGKEDMLENDTENYDTYPDS